MRAPAPAREPPGAALAQRETRFATRSVFPFVLIQHCQRRWKRLRVRSPGPALTRKPKSSRAKSPKRKSICAACAMRAINSCPITLSNQDYDSDANMRMKVKVLSALLRPNPPDMSTEALKFVTSTPQGPHKLATILLQVAKKLLAMDRYERRALSRRKFAIRAFDAANRDRAG